MSGKTGIFLFSSIISNFELSEGAIIVYVSRRERCYQRSYARTPLSLIHTQLISVQLKLLPLLLKTGLENGQNSFSWLCNNCQEKRDRSARRQSVYKFIYCGQIYFLYLKPTILYIP